MELVGNFSSHLGEGPFWDSVSKRLLWVDILGKKILEHDFENDVTIGRDVSGNPGCVVLADDETLVAAIDNGIFSISRLDGSVQRLVEADSIPRLRFDPTRVAAGDPAEVVAAAGRRRGRARIVHRRVRTAGAVGCRAGAKRPR